MEGGAWVGLRAKRWCWEAGLGGKGKGPETGLNGGWGLGQTSAPGLEPSRWSSEGEVKDRANGRK